jgi:hypothetical protein
MRWITVQSQPWQIAHKTLSQKNPTQNRIGGAAKLVEHLSSKSEALSSNTRPTKEGKKKNIYTYSYGIYPEDIPRIKTSGCV